MIGLVTDSNACLPPELAQRYGVEIVPLTVTVDGTPYLEGVELDADAFYARLASAQSRPEISTAAPSPGLFLNAYETLAQRGVTDILSVHLGSEVSATVNAARLAIGGLSSPVRVRIVDTGTASFGVTCCLWEAAEALAANASLEEAAAIAEQVAATVGNVFVAGALELAQAGGRLTPDVDVEAAQATRVLPVLSLAGGIMAQVGHATDLDEAAHVMAEYVRHGGDRLRVGVGVADAGATSLYQALEDRLATAPEVLEVVRYRIGPSVGAHIGPGGAGAFFYPALIR